ncbi:hypothetical protein Hanom_Chr09g00829961 [Helianthus anomalus]
MYIGRLHNNYQNLKSLVTNVIFTLPLPHYIFQGWSNIILTELLVFERIAGGLRKLYNRHLWRHLEHLHRHRQLPFSPLGHPLHLHFIIILFRFQHLQV